MTVNRDIIVMGIQPWDIEIGSNAKNIAIEFSKQNRVLYVNPPLDRITRYRDSQSPRVQKRIRVGKGLEPDLVPLSPTMWNLFPAGLTESINRIPWAPVFDVLNRRNGKILADAIHSAIRRLHFRDYILFNDSSMFLGLHMKALLAPSLYVYYMRDFLTKNPYWRRHGVRLEPRLIRNADLVVNNSALYTEYGMQFNPHSYMVGQGCDVTMFDDQLQEIIPAEEITALPRPVIGYVGYLSSRRLDIPLLITIAQKRPEWTIALVGPEDETFRNSALHGMANLVFTGPRDQDKLPAFIKGFDVCINPQQINDATRGNYPRKIDEYLAMGKPVVATSTEAMEYFRAHTFLGKTPEDYMELIESALRDDNSEKQQSRRNFARSHTWENNVKEIYLRMEQVFSERNQEKK